MGSVLDESMENALCSVIELGEAKLKQMEEALSQYRGHITKLYEMLFVLNPAKKEEKKEGPTPQTLRVRRNYLKRGKRWEQIKLFLRSHDGQYTAQEIANELGTTRCAITCALNRSKRALYVDKSSRPYLYKLR